MRSPGATAYGSSRTPPARSAAWQGGQHAGTLGDLGAFSFHPRKSITTGEGGMLTTARATGTSLRARCEITAVDRSDLDRHASQGSFLLADFKDSASTTG